MPPSEPRPLRWCVAAVLCAITAFNYLDRQMLPLLAHEMERAWGLTTTRYSLVTACWLASYTVMYAVGGRIVDLLGTRRGLSLFVGAWSVIDALHALARNLSQFFGLRILLGAAEAANMPAGVKAVTEWFPVRERALAVGLFNAGTAIGAGMAPPVVAWVARRYGWQSNFWLGAAAGAVCAVLWYAVARRPGPAPSVGSPAARVDAPAPISRLLRFPETWGCVAARAITDPISYLFAFWIPRYLQDQRGFDLNALGRYYWAPYVGLLLGNLAGGAIPRWLTAAGLSLDRSRKGVMLAASVVMAVCFLLITRVDRPALALACIGGAMFCHAAWANMTLPAEVFPPRVVASVSGLAGAVGSFVSAAAMLAIGRAANVRSYGPVFAVYAALPITAFVVVCVLVRRLGEIRDLADQIPQPAHADPAGFQPPG